MEKRAKKNLIYNYIVALVCVVAISNIQVLFSCFVTVVSQELMDYNGTNGNALVSEIFPGLSEDEKLIAEMEPSDIEYQAYEWIVAEEPAIIATATDAKEALSPVTIEGIQYAYEDLLDYNYLTQNCLNISSSATVYPEEIDVANMLAMDTTVDLSGDDYKVLIYHTHGSESYQDSKPGVPEDTVIGVGDELTRILTEKYGVKVYHDRTAYDCLDGVLDRDYAYEYSSVGVDQILAQYPSIELIIDVHRDGVREDLHLSRVIDGKPCAQLMFVCGVSRLASTGDVDYLENPYKKENIAFEFALHLAGKELYGDLIRKNYISGYRYNLNKMPKAVLVEVGAQTNTVEEAKNAMEPLAATIYKVISGK